MYVESHEHIETCETTLAKFDSVTASVVGVFTVQKAVDLRTGPLEYGFNHAAKALEKVIEAGIEIDPRFPDRAFKEVEENRAKRDKLVRSHRSKWIC
jgi:hypothetical protein